MRHLVAEPDSESNDSHFPGRVGIREPSPRLDFVPGFETRFTDIVNPDRSRNVLRYVLIIFFIKLFEREIVVSRFEGIGNRAPHPV
jgi:hypothetical protein